MHKSRSDEPATSDTWPDRKVSRFSEGIPHRDSLAKYAVAFLEFPLLRNARQITLQPTDLVGLSIDLRITFAGRENCFCQV